MADNFWEKMSGTKKQSYGPSLYNAKEMKKWQKEQDKWYKDLGTTRDRYGTQSTKFMGKYEEAEGEADRYRGLAEGSFGDARRSIGRADTSFGRSQADISRARQSQSSANALMADRDHYSNLKRNAEARRRGIQGDRLSMQGLRGRLGKPARDTGMTQRLMDAFKGSNESGREMMEANTAQLAKVNPVAAARMQAQFNEGTLRSLGQLKQQGMVTDQQLSDNNLTREAGMLMDSTSLYGQEAAQDQMAAGIHQQQIQNFGAAGTQALNTAGAEGAIARGRLAQAGQYGQIGAQYGSLGSQLDARAGRALGAGMDYEGMGYQALQDQTSISNRRVERQDKFRMSDAAARARVDSFNRSRAQQGISNALKVVETGARIYGAVATAGATEAAIAAMNARNKGGGGGGGGGDQGGGYVAPGTTDASWGPGGKYGVQNPSYTSRTSSLIRPVQNPGMRDGWQAGQDDYNPSSTGSNFEYDYPTDFSPVQSMTSPPNFPMANAPQVNPDYGMSYSAPRQWYKPSKYTVNPSRNYRSPQQAYSPY
jgi:hypothetical protein